MIATYISEKYNPKEKYSRYVRKDGNGVYYWCEVGKDRFNYRQGTAEASEIPSLVRQAADALCGFFPSYVDWPA